MSRLRRAAHGVASSYVQLAATAVYALASVPVALHYLDKERFGLWALVGTLSGYLNLIDAGMSGAASRLLIDHKDDRTGGGYGSMIKTGWIVSLVQAVIVLGAGLLLAPTFAQLLAVPMTLQPEFIQLIRWQCAVLALSFAARVLGMILNAHQRMDWWNYSSVVALMASFGVQWLLFHIGFGVLSLAGGSFIGGALAIVLQGVTCQRLKLFPEAGGWGQPSWRLFKEMFNYGKDLFLVSVGAQLINGSQIIVITRLLGLEAAAAWSVGLRMFNLLNQVVWRIYDMSISALAEMMVRGETARLRDRYRSLTILSVSFAGWTGVSLAICNSLFVAIWTHGKIQWPAGNDWLLALWMIVVAGVRCYNCFIGLTKQIHSMRYVYFIEGVVFVGLSCLVARWGGLPAIIGCSIVCTLALSGAYGAWRISRYFEILIREVIWTWLKPMFKALMIYAPVALLVWKVADSSPVILRLGLNAALAGSLGAYLFLRLGLPAALQSELLERVPAGPGSLLKKVLGKPARQTKPLC